MQLGGGMSIKSVTALGAVLLFTLLVVSPAVAGATAPAGTPLLTGFDDYGQLGLETFVYDSTTPLPPIGVTGVVAASTGYYQTLVALSSGAVEAWGYNGYGELGDGTKTERTTPELINGIAHVTSVAAGYYHSLALTNEGTVYAWGYNGYGELGNGAANTESLVPEQVKGVSGVAQIAAGCDDSFAVLENGEVDAWGYNDDGELGDGTKTERTSPERLPGLKEVLAISASCDHTLALLRNGTVEAWGYNEDGDVNGQATSGIVESPVSVGLSNVKAISSGDEFDTALLDNGTVDAWGENEYGNLGDGAKEVKLTPQPVLGLSNVAAISSGGYFTIALLENRSLEGFGYDGYGELGSGLPGDVLHPTQLSYPAAGIGLATGNGDNYTSLVIEGAAASVSSTSFAFPTQTIGTTSASQSIVLTNNGPASLSISGDSLSGSGASAFHKTSDSCQGATLAAGATCSVAYAFVPGAAGVASATLTVSSSAAQPLPSFSLSGTGVAPAALVAPSLGSLTLSASAFRAASSGASAIAASASTGTFVIYTDSQASTTTFVVEQQLHGVIAGSGKSKGCGKAPKHSKKGAKRCTYYKTLGSFTHTDAAGTNALRFTGRIAGRALAAGSYRLSASAHSAGGTSAVRTVAFKISR